MLLSPHHLTALCWALCSKSVSVLSRVTQTQRPNHTSLVLSRGEGSPPQPLGDTLENPAQGIAGSLTTKSYCWLRINSLCPRSFSGNLLPLHLGGLQLILVLGGVPAELQDSRGLAHEPLSPACAPGWQKTLCFISSSASILPQLPWRCRASREQPGSAIRQLPGLSWARPRSHRDVPVPFVAPWPGPAPPTPGAPLGGQDPVATLGSCRQLCHRTDCRGSRTGCRGSCPSSSLLWGQPGVPRPRRDGGPCPLGTRCCQGCPPALQ